MFADLLDTDELELLIANHVDSSIGETQSNRPLTPPIALERFIVVAGDFSHSFKAGRFDRFNPSREL
jgi:hypothetical protein